MPLFKEGDSKAWESILYQSIEMRHNTDTYYQVNGSRDKQFPEVRLKIQLGALLYQGHVDAYVTGGIIRYAQSQQVFQERPELSIDLYPVKTRYFKVRQYHRIRLPYQMRDTEIKHYDSRWEQREDQNGTIYQPGLNPWIEWPISIGSIGHFELKGGLDLHTFMYSQAFKEQAGSIESDDHKDSEKPLISSRQFISASFSPWFSPRLLIKTSMYYESRFASQAFFAPRESSNKTTYGVDRNASYRVRARFTLSERVSLINDFYHFHRGFFEGRQKGGSKRFRNTLRLTTLL